MFRLIKGASFSGVSALKEEYSVSGKELTANVSAEHIADIFDAFLRRMAEDEPMYLFVELPCKLDREHQLNSLLSGENQFAAPFHRDVYYLDGRYRNQMLQLIKSEVGELLIHDGFTHFGFGSHASHAELGKYKYNVLTGFEPGSAVLLPEIFDSFGIPRVPSVVTAWDLFSDGNPGDSFRYEVDGKSVYDLVEQLKGLGLYLAETREE